MGVSGSGKSTVGKILAALMGLPFYDADDYHPSGNVAKMAHGISLSDEDRKPWLETLAGEIARWNAGGGAVLACSALRERYRSVLSREQAGKVLFIFLHGGLELLKSRLQRREAHFFGSGLLQSQLDALEIPKQAISVDIGPPPDQIARQVLAELTARGLAPQGERILK
jgi:carbohydrate kinase (thermoresistant glucokinase family)